MDVRTSATSKITITESILGESVVTISLLGVA